MLPEQANIGSVQGARRREEAQVPAAGVRCRNGLDRAIDILGLNETRLDNTIAESQIDIEGYDILRRDRNRNGGGVAFYVAQSLTYVNRQDLLSHEDLEILTVEIKGPFTWKEDDPSAGIILALGSSERGMFSAFSLHVKGCIWPQR